MMAKHYFKIIPVLIIFSLLFVVPCSAADDISVYVNDNKIDFDVAPMAINERTLIPFRYVANAFGADVDYLISPTDGNTYVFATLGEKKLTLTVGSTSAVLEEKETKQLLKFDVSPVIINNRTLVPIRLIAEAFDCFVGWNGENSQVIIINPKDLAEYTQNHHKDFFDNVLNISKENLSEEYAGSLSLKGFPQIPDTSIPLVSTSDGNTAKITSPLFSSFPAELDTSGHFNLGEEIGRALIQAHWEDTAPTTGVFGECINFIDYFAKSIEDGGGLKIENSESGKSISFNSVIKGNESYAEIAVNLEYANEKIKELKINVSDISEKSGNAEKISEATLILSAK